MLANCDPRRDCMIIDGQLDILDHAAPAMASAARSAGRDAGSWRTRGRCGRIRRSCG